MPLKAPPPFAEPLAILPGLICDSRMFGAQLSKFDNAIIVDDYYPGCETIEEMAEFALANLPDKFNLLGHSMGGRVAIEIMRCAPDRVLRLALADTGMHIIGEGEKERRYALRDIGRGAGFPALVAEWLPPMLAPQSRSNDMLLSALTEMCVDAGQAIFERQIEALLRRPVVDDVLADIKCPTFAIVGALDNWSPIEQHEEITARISGSILKIVPDAGHMLPAEMPAKFNYHIAEWLGLPLTG